MYEKRARHGDEGILTSSANSGKCLSNTMPSIDREVPSINAPYNIYVHAKQPAAMPIFGPQKSKHCIKDPLSHMPDPAARS